MTAVATTASSLTTTPTWASGSPRQPAGRSRPAPRHLLTEPILVPLTLTESVVFLRVKQPEPAWFYPLLSRLQQLIQLGDNWDSYGGQPPRDQAITTALNLLAGVLRHESIPPAIVPTSEGGVQLEWHRSGSELEIRVRPTSEISAFRFDEAAGTGATIEHIDLADLRSLFALTGQL